MKKIVLLITLILVGFSSLLTAATGEEKLENFINDTMLFVLYPHDGSYDINLRDVNHYYPERKDGATVVWGGDNEEPEPSIAGQSGSYYQFQMVAFGILEGFYVSHSFEDDDDSGNTMYRVTWDYENKSFPPIEVTVDCSSDFKFVSQSDTSYKRPFELYLIRNYESVNAPGAGSGQTERTVIKINDSSPHDVEFVGSANNEYVNLWFDLIVGLPGEMDDNGVLYENIYYPLSDATDYTAEVTITMEWEMEYQLQRRDKGPLGVLWQDWYNVDSGTKRIFKTITIPFSGYCSFSAPEESVGSLYISTTAESQNINLNPDYVSPVKVADISYLYNFGSGVPGSYKPVYEENENNRAWLFLSASPDPWSNSESNHFRMYHVEAGSNADEYNSVPFMVYVEDTDGSGQYVEFSGNAEAYDFIPTGGASDDFIRTECNFGKSRSEYRFWDWDKFDYVTNPEQRYHYHSFDGEVWVEVTPEVDIMAAGRYVGDIYVHVIAEDV